MAAKSPKVIYRYQPIRPDAIDLIRSGRLWFSDPSRFNDPFDLIPNFKDWEVGLGRLLDQSREEAYWTDSSIRGSRASFLKDTQNQRDDLVRHHCRIEQRRFLRRFSKHFRVACFSETKDSILMWSHYAAYHTGMCIGMRPPQMRLSPQLALRWKVDYCDARLSLDHPNLNEIALRKAKAWEYEAEWRIVMATKDLAIGKRPLLRDRSAPKKPRFEAGYFLKLQWDAIESIRFGALVDRKKRSVVLKALQAEERRHIQAIQMRLSVDRFALEEEVLQR